MSVSEILSDSESKMKKAVEVLHDDLKAVRSGRASTGLVENIKADFYGTPTPLKQMATLAAPQVDMIVIKPFDSASMKEIEKAIKASDLSIAPIVDGGGGGRAHMAQAGGKRPDKIDEALEKAAEMIKEQLANTS